MDDSGDYETNDELFKEDLTHADNEHEKSLHVAGEELSLQYTIKGNSNDEHQTIKWMRLRKHYSDQYLELFNTTYAEGSNDKSLEDSQLGSVMWTASEKRMFFTALSRNGRHDLASISNTLQTKSEVEVKDYLDLLKNAHIERQMFADRTKNVSQAQIEAAVEVGKECEAMLDNAADALAAYQDCYDRALARHQPGELWLIDIETAEKLDAQTNEMENEQRSDDEMSQEGFHQKSSHEMFHLSKFLELSRKLFMNTPPKSEHMHWTQLADVDESPSIATDAIDIFYSLVVSLVQRILQSAIFLAQSRIRAMTTSSFTAAQVLQETDIEAALNVLNMPLDAFGYWVKWVKRSKVNVVGGSQKKGQSDRDKLSFRQVEEILSIRATRGRHRSLSSLISMTSTDGSTAGDSDTERHLPMVEDEGVPEEGSEADPLPTTGYSTDSNDTDDDDLQEAQISDAHERSDEVNLSPQTADVPYVSRKRRLQMLDNEQDEYMERLDQASRNREEAYLYQFLGKPSIKAESSEGPGWHPNIQRKTMEELHDWAEVPYRSVWEHFAPSQLADNSTGE